MLIGNNTKYLRKFVKWEIETAIRLNLPIICVNINGSKVRDNLCPTSLNDKLSIFIPFRKKIMQYTLENWPNSHYNHIKNGESRPYYYNKTVYDRLS